MRMVGAGTSTGIAKTGSRSLPLLLSTVFLVQLATGSVGALTQNLVASPSPILLGPIDASIQGAAELVGGLTLFLPGDNLESTISVTVAKPLTERSTRQTLPANRFRVGLMEWDSSILSDPGTLGLVGDTGRTLRVSSANGRTKLRVGIVLDKFDPPGNYDGELSIALANSPVPPVKVELQCEARKWAKISSTGLFIQLNTSAPPGPSSYLSSGWTGALKVASNCSWRLTVFPNGDLANQSAGSSGTIPGTALTLRVQTTQFVQPISEQYVALSTQPTLLATGSPTVTCSGGWATVTIDGQLPFGRQYMGGSYRDSLEFSVAPQ